MRAGFEHLDDWTIPENIFVTFSELEDWEWIWLKKLWVWEDYRNSGYARQLIDFLYERYWRIVWQIDEIWDLWFYTIVRVCEALGFDVFEWKVLME